MRFIKETINCSSNIVEVVMDRPFGSKHLKHGFIYPVNYCYIPNTVSGDGKELDAYVLGVLKPVETFKGRVIAIIHRIIIMMIN